MKVSVYPRGSNPRVDRHIQRKSLSYVTREVAEGRADWVDPGNPDLGIVCREFLFFGNRAEPVPVATVALSNLPAELPGLKFVGPRTEKNQTLSRLILPPMESVIRGWDYATA